MPMSDDEVAFQILQIFARNEVKPEGFLRRNNFFTVRDGEFQRGMNKAMVTGWLRPHERDRYKYILTDCGYDALEQRTQPA
jgi:hypothetical protein